MRSLCYFAASALIASVCFSQSAKAVELNPGPWRITYFRVEADGYGSGSGSQDDLIATALPYFDSHEVSQTPGSDPSASETAASGTYTLDQQGFNIQYDLTRGVSRLFDPNVWAFGVVYFSVDVDSPYRLDGAFTASDPGRRVHFGVQLTDVTAGTLLFKNAQESWSTPDEMFELGGVGGDHSNILSGDIEGLLLTGHEYEFAYSAIMNTYPVPDTEGGIASGFASLMIIPESPTPVEIDIRPWSDTNPINPFARGVIPVAILGSDTFDVADMDVTTLAFGPSGAAPAHRVGGHYQDVNGDGLTDLLSHYRTQDTGIAVGDTEACVTGATLVGAPLEGCDFINTQPNCGNGFETALVVAPLVLIGGRMRRRRGAAGRRVFGLSSPSGQEARGGPRPGLLE